MVPHLGIRDPYCVYVPVKVKPRPHQDEVPHPVLVRMPAELHNAVKAKATAEDRSMAQAIRVVLRHWVEDS